MRRWQAEIDSDKTDLAVETRGTFAGLDYLLYIPLLCDLNKMQGQILGFQISAYLRQKMQGIDSMVQLHQNLRKQELLPHSMMSELSFCQPKEDWHCILIGFVVQSGSSISEN